MCPMLVCSLFHDHIPNTLCFFFLFLKTPKRLYLVLHLVFINQRLDVRLL